MNWIRVALVACVAALAWAALPNRTVIVDTHGATRQLIIASTLARVDDPIVVLGDSIVEGSTLPRSLCGHAIVNAGIGGASTASHLGSVLKEALAAKRAALIIVSLGTNDAAVPMSVEQYRTNYRGLLAELDALAPRRAIAAIPPPEAGLPEAKKVRSPVIDSYNAILPALAEKARAAFIPLPPMPEHHTLDGIHLNAAGYEAWEGRPRHYPTQHSANRLESVTNVLSSGLNSCSVLQGDLRQIARKQSRRAPSVGAGRGTGNTPWSIGEPIRW